MSHCDAVVVVIAMTVNGKNTGVSAMLPWCGSPTRFDYRDVSQQHLVDMRGTAACCPSVNVSMTLFNQSYKKSPGTRSSDRCPHLGSGGRVGHPPIRRSVLVIRV